MLAYIRSLLFELPLSFLFLLRFSRLRVLIRHEPHPESRHSRITFTSGPSAVIPFAHRLTSGRTHPSAQSLAVRLDTGAESPGSDSSTPALPCLRTHRPLPPSDWLVRGQKRGRLARSLLSRPKFIAWLPALSCRRPVISSSSRISTHPVHTFIGCTEAF